MCYKKEKKEDDSITIFTRISTCHNNVRLKIVMKEENTHKTNKQISSHATYLLFDIDWL